MAEEELSEEQPDDAWSLIVDDESAGTRLDTFLASLITITSRSQIRRAIEAGKILIDGTVVVKPAYPVSPGERIEVTLLPSAPLEAKPSPIPLDILFEDEAIIVINKPAGMVTHPGAGATEGTMANALVHYFAEQSLQLPRRGGPSRPGIVHRLDVGTSGVIVVAKTDEAHLRLAEQFQARRVRKIYQALVYGAINEDSGMIDLPIGRDPRNRLKMAVRPAGEGRDALSLFRVIERFREFTLLEVEIKTGRTHQIRVHLAHRKHPIAGDSIYDAGRANSLRDAKVRSAIARLKRPFLHAAQLGLFHPLTGEWREFSAPLPEDLQAFLALVRSNSLAFN